MLENLLSGANVFIFIVHLHGNQFSKIMSVLLGNTNPLPPLLCVKYTEALGIMKAKKLQKWGK
jgi:hypothetical protein